MGFAEDDSPEGRLGSSVALLEDDVNGISSTRDMFSVAAGPRAPERVYEKVFSRGAYSVVRRLMDGMLLKGSEKPNDVSSGMA